MKVIFKDKRLNKVGGKHQIVAPYGTSVTRVQNQVLQDVLRDDGRKEINKIQFHCFPTEINLSSLQRHQT